MIQLAIALSGLITAFLLVHDQKGKYKLIACLLGVLAQPFWALAAIKADQWGQLAATAGFLYVYAYGLWKEIKCKSQV